MPAAPPDNASRDPDGGGSQRYAEAAKDLLRSRILDSVHHLVDERGWAKASMAQVAAGAGVSRQTVYNEYGDRDGLARAYVLREADRFLDRVDAAVDAAASNGPAVAIRAGFEAFLAGARDHPVLGAVLAGDDADGLLTLLASPDASPVLDVAVERLRATLARHWPEPGPVERSLPEILVRLALSYATLPPGDPSAAVDTVMAVVEPGLDRTPTE